MRFCLQKLSPFRAITGCMVRRYVGCLLLGPMVLGLEATDLAILDRLAEVTPAMVRITDKETSGTGFLVASPGDVGSRSNLVWLVTAAHTFERFPKEQCFVVLREGRLGEAPARREVPLRIRAENRTLWLRHPRADVAVMQFEVLQEIRLKALPFESLASERDFTAGRVRLGAGSWVFCYPAQLEADESGTPILRHGTVASLPPNSLGTNSTFLVDYPNFGGDSGAALLVESGETPRTLLVAGVVQGMHRQTDKYSISFEERTVHYPMGLGIVVPAEYIIQVLQEAMKAARTSQVGPT